MATARQQPPWKAPQVPEGVTDLPPLKVYNSLTRSKVPFVPIKAKEREISWYVCGPTVYDDSHLGHARNYVTTDIIRRIFRDFFGFKVNFVMNITDVDDKVGFGVPYIYTDYSPRHRSFCAGASSTFCQNSWRRTPSPRWFH